MDAGVIAIGNVALVPLILALIQALKRFASDAPPNLWFGLSVILGLLGQVVVFLIAHGETFVGWTLSTWALCLVLGLQSGLTTGKAYDELHAGGKL